MGGRMVDLAPHESVELLGSSGTYYRIKHVGGVYTCTCPAWLHQSTPVAQRSCKHIRAIRGDAAEEARTGGPPPPRSPRAAAAAAAVKSTAPPLLLAHSWTGAEDVIGWWMSEKLDGVRAYWNGEAFVSRLGNVYAAPPWFTAQLPRQVLDGELWGGRKRFQRTVSIVRRQDEGREWEEIRFVVFDAPELAAPFEERLAQLDTWLAPGVSPYASPLAQARCEDRAHLDRELDRVEALGGEGLMLRRPGSRYEVGRSYSLLKVKRFSDAEARVVAHLPGTGKHSGRLGAVLVEMLDGTRFSVGTGFTDAEREAPPPIGAIVTYRYQELSDGGVPRFPTFVAIRDDYDFEAERAKLR